MASSAKPVDDQPAPSLDLALDTTKSSVVTMEPYEELIKTVVLLVKPVPLDWSFYDLHKEFSKFGSIKEIKNRLGEGNKYFENWIFYSKMTEAHRAYKDFSSDTMTVRLVKAEEVPRYLDVYRPESETEDTRINKTSRLPDPAKWLIITTRSERGNLFKVKKLINEKIGNINRPAISRFGRNSFLVNTKSDGQAVMLLNLRLDPEGLIKEVKPHYNFSYVKGVIFNDDMYELDEEEILEMCPKVVFKVFKVPRSSMIILTFINSYLPPEIIIDNEIIRVRPHRPRVLQCFNCFGFGHSSRICTRNKICELCGQAEHGECSRPVVLYV